MKNNTEKHEAVTTPEALKFTSNSITIQLVAIGMTVAIIAFIVAFTAFGMTHSPTVFSSITWGFIAFLSSLLCFIATIAAIGAAISHQK